MPATAFRERSIGIARSVCTERSLKALRRGGARTLPGGGTFGTRPEPFLGFSATAVPCAVSCSVNELSGSERPAFVISTGRYRHLLSPRHRDPGAFWRHGKYAPTALDPGAAMTGTVENAWLLPEE
ncbi:MAG: hypothetical protein OXH76_23070 [Boseongicola sp.]|nr:hypothetical protein [Boseongicola sp.]